MSGYLFLGSHEVTSDVRMAPPIVPACVAFAHTGTPEDARDCVDDMNTDSIALVDLRREPGDAISLSRGLEQQLQKDTSGLLNVRVMPVTATDEVLAAANAPECVDIGKPSTIGSIIVRRLMGEDVAEYDKIITINSLSECNLSIAGIAHPDRGDAQLFGTDSETPQQIIRDAEHEILHLYRLQHSDVLRRTGTEREALEKYFDFNPRSLMRIPLEEVFRDTTSSERGEGVDLRFGFAQGGQYGAIMGQPSDTPLDDRIPNAQNVVLGYPYEVAGQSRPYLTMLGDEPLRVGSHEAGETVVGVDIEYPSPLRPEQTFSRLLLAPMVLQPFSKNHEVIVGSSVYLADSQRGHILKLGDIVYKPRMGPDGIIDERQTYQIEMDGKNIRVTFDGHGVEVDAL